MILSNELTPSQVANSAGCHTSTITRHITNMGLFGSPKAPHMRRGCPRRLTPEMIKALSDYLIERLYSMNQLSSCMTSLKSKFHHATSVEQHTIQKPRNTWFMVCTF
jgi:transposase